MNRLDANMTMSRFANTLATTLNVSKREQFTDFLHEVVREIGQQRCLVVVAEVKWLREQNTVRRAADMFVDILRMSTTREEKLRLFTMKPLPMTPFPHTVDHCIQRLVTLQKQNVLSLFHRRWCTCTISYR